MPEVGFESAISVFERAKTVHALNNAATVIGPLRDYYLVERDSATWVFN
jgi:hypothetical protein